MNLEGKSCAVGAFFRPTLAHHSFSCGGSSVQSPTEKKFQVEGFGLRVGKAFLFSTRNSQLYITSYIKPRTSYAERRTRFPRYMSETDACFFSNIILQDKIGRLVGGIPIKFNQLFS